MFALGESGERQEMERAGEGGWGAGLKTGVLGLLLHPAFTGCKQLTPGDTYTLTLFHR